MDKLIIFIVICGFALVYGQGYDSPQAEEPKNGKIKHKGEGWVRGGQEEGHNDQPSEQPINHEYSFDGKTPSHPDPPPAPAARGDGPAPASYPPLTPNGINSGKFSGKGGYQEGSAPASPSSPGSSAPAPQQGGSYKQ